MEGESSHQQNRSEIPFELVSEEEMALIEAALSSATRSSSLSLLSTQRNRIALTQSSLQTKRGLSACTETSNTQTPTEIEDLGTQKRIKVSKSLLEKFRRRRCLSVTDITASEWCEKQMEFILVRGKPKRTDAMKAGSKRHAALEEEVVKKVEVSVQSAEDSWAIKFMNFISGAHQLLFDGLTRELQVLGLVEGVWMIGVIDEIRMTVTGSTKSPLLIDTKSRFQATLPSEAQKRNGRLQLMCYKYLWDTTIAGNFPTTFFYKYFGLRAQWVLSREVQEYVTNSGFDAKTLEELVSYYINMCSSLPPAHEQLMLRYELQSDHSLLDEHQFAYDDEWFKSQVQWHLKFWLGQREAEYALEDERWKCRHCSFSSICPLTQSRNPS